MPVSPDSPLASTEVFLRASDGDETQIVSHACQIEVAAYHGPMRIATLDAQWRAEYACWIIGQIWVEAPHRRCGWGTKLLQLAEQRLGCEVQHNIGQMSDLAKVWSLTGPGQHDAGYERDEQMEQLIETVEYVKSLDAAKPIYWLTPDADGLTGYDPRRPGVLGEQAGYLYVVAVDGLAPGYEGRLRLFELGDAQGHLTSDGEVVAESAQLARELDVVDDLRGTRGIGDAWRAQGIVPPTPLLASMDEVLGLTDAPSRTPSPPAQPLG